MDRYRSRVLAYSDSFNTKKDSKKITRMDTNPGVGRSLLRELLFKVHRYFSTSMGMASTIWVATLDMYRELNIPLPLICTHIFVCRGC